MNHPQTLWRCPKCGFKVWLYQTTTLNRTKHHEFRHYSDQRPRDVLDEPCPQHLVPTNSKRPNYASEVVDPYAPEYYKPYKYYPS